MERLKQLTALAAGLGHAPPDLSNYVAAYDSLMDNASLAANADLAAMFRGYAQNALREACAKAAFSLALPFQAALQAMQHNAGLTPQAGLGQVSAEYPLPVTLIGSDILSTYELVVDFQITETGLTLVHVRRDKPTSSEALPDMQLIFRREWLDISGSVLGPNLCSIARYVLSALEHVHPQLIDDGIGWVRICSGAQVLFS